MPRTTSTIPFRLRDDERDLACRALAYLAKRMDAHREGRVSERLLTNMSAFDGLSLEQKKEAVTFAAYVTGYPVWVSSEAYDCNGRPLASCFSVHTDWPARDHSTFWRAFEAAEDEIRERDGAPASQWRRTEKQS